MNDTGNKEFMDIRLGTVMKEGREKVWDFSFLESERFYVVDALWYLIYHPPFFSPSRQFLADEMEKEEGRIG